MNAMSILMTIWAVLTTVLAVLLIYRSALTMHEDDQLFLDSAESHLEKEQQQLMVRMNRLQPYVNILGASSGLLILLMVGLWLWRGWNGM
jgi:predicted tellurium resistance membrane protein TerC